MIAQDIDKPLASNTFGTWICDTFLALDFHSSVCYRSQYKDMYICSVGIKKEKVLSFLHSSYWGKLSGF